MRKLNTGFLRPFLWAQVRGGNLEKIDRYIEYIKIGITRGRDIIRILCGDYVFFPQIEIALTTKCSLRCKDCSNLMQYYKTPQHIEKGINQKSIKAFLESVDEVDRFILLGGEPFIYPDLKEIMDLLELYSNKIHQIWIYTNGTVIPHDDRLIKSLCRNNVVIYASHYGKYSIKIDELRQLCIDNRINIQIQDKESDHEWLNAGDLRKRGRNEKELIDQFKKCNPGCYSILKGKLHYCARSSSAHDLKVMENHEYVNLLECNSNRRKKMIANFLYRKPKYLEICDHCDRGTNEERLIPAAIQTKFPLEIMD